MEDSRSDWNHRRWSASKYPSSSGSAMAQAGVCASGPLLRSEWRADTSGWSSGAASASGGGGGTFGGRPD